MKLEKMAEKAIEMLQFRGSQGISNTLLADQLNVPKRRVYDVIAILRAANLVSTSRNKFGITIFWEGSELCGLISKKSRIQSNTIRVSTSGTIVAVSNKGTEVIIEASCPSMDVEGM